MRDPGKLRKLQTEKWVNEGERVQQTREREQEKNWKNSKHKTLDTWINDS